VQLLALDRAVLLGREHDEVPVRRHGDARERPDVRRILKLPPLQVDRRRPRIVNLDPVVTFQIDIANARRVVGEKLVDDRIPRREQLPLLQRLHDRARGRADRPAIVAAIALARAPDFTVP
jgi:hypothetical protein